MKNNFKFYSSQPPHPSANSIFPLRSNLSAGHGQEESVECI